MSPALFSFVAAALRIGPPVLLTGVGAGRAVPIVVRLPLVVVFALFITPLVPDSSTWTGHALVGAGLTLALGAVVLGASWTGRLLGETLARNGRSMSMLTEAMLGTWLFAAGAPLVLLATAALPSVNMPLLRFAELADAVLAGAIAFALPVIAAAYGAESVIARVADELGEGGRALQSLPVPTLLAASLTCAAVAAAIPWYGEAVLAIPDWLLKSQG